MEFTVYRQASKERPDGTIVYKGEDALPYVDDSLIMVADGLGGAAAIRHQHINAELFESDQIVDALFEGIYPDYSDPVFTQYVVRSFAELFAVKDCYMDNVNNIKKSGYFASRIVCSILLHELKYNQSVTPDTLFKYLDAVENDPQKKEALMNRLGNYLALKLQGDMQRIAEKAHLVYESSYSGLALLGTTLCAAIIREQNKQVDAIYLMAGDSRPYLWSRDTGLCQILDDQEGSDGGMTNYIKANAGSSFDICCHSFSFPMPCILFNASDGCFDSGKFLSPLSFEKTILETIVTASNETEASRALEAFFTDYGRHDDSSTMAAKVIGYETYQDLQRDANERLGEIEKRYLTALPDILDRNYVAEAEANEKLLLDYLEGKTLTKEQMESLEQYRLTRPELQGKAAFQKRVFESYDKEYGRYLEEAQL